MTTTSTRYGTPAREHDDYAPYREGRVATAIEQRTAHMPSDIFLWSAGASIAASLALQMMGRKDDARFVGQWAPTLLTIGVYNKMVKLFGSD